MSDNLCQARTKTGAECKRFAIRGGVVCATHGGSAPQVRAAANRRIALRDIESAAVRLGMSVDVDPIDAILEMVAESAANVAAYRMALEDLEITVAADGSAVAVPASYDKRGGRDPALAHILVEMYNTERDRLVNYSKKALDAGVDERRVRVAEATAQRLGKVIEAAVAACNPTSEERAAALQAAGRVLRQLTAGENQ